MAAQAEQRTLADLSRTRRATSAPTSSDLGFTHVEFLPVTEHPFDGSWGYQPTGLFAPTSRFGTPADFCALVDACHAPASPCMLDWVPGHFPDDPHGLARFDGTALYEHANPQQGRHLDWDTLIYNFGRTEVANFLLASGLFWLGPLRHRRAARRCGRLHALSRLQPPRRRLDSEQVRRPREPRSDRIPAPLQHRAVRALSRGHDGGRGVHRMADGVTAGRMWRARLRLQVEHGVDARHARTTSARIPIHRKHHHGEILFGLHYAFSENFILPLSHDEVVHGKRSILGRMPGDEWQRFANLRAYYAFMFGHPGKKLMFMGSEFGQEREWSHDHPLDWHLLDQPESRRHPEPDSRSQQALSHAAGAARARLRARRVRVAGHARRRPQRVRLAAQGQRYPRRAVSWSSISHRTSIMTIASSVPFAGKWREVLNTDCRASMAAPMSGTAARSRRWNGLVPEVSLALPPLAAIFLVPES